MSGVLLFRIVLVKDPLGRPFGLACRVRHAMTDRPGRVGGRVTEFPCGMSRLLGGILRALLDVLLHLAQVGLRRGAEDGEHECGEQDVATFHGLCPPNKF